AAAYAEGKPALPPADSSVVTVPRRAVAAQQDKRPKGTGLPQVTRARVTWPKAGSARLTVPAVGGAPAPVGPGAVSVTAPREVTRAAGAPPQVEVTVYDQATARKLGGYGTAVRVTRTDTVADKAMVGVRIDVSGFVGAFGGGFESRLRLVAKPACT